MFSEFVTVLTRDLGRLGLKRCRIVAPCVVHPKTTTARPFDATIRLDMLRDASDRVSWTATIEGTALSSSVLKDEFYDEVGVRDSERFDVTWCVAAHLDPETWSKANVCVFSDFPLPSRLRHVFYRVSCYE